MISDLVTFVEQQQFLSVAGIHRQPPSLDERVRARALRLAASKAALRRAAARLAGGAAALRAQEGVENRFLGDLSQLRRRWRLARHAGEGERLNKAVLQHGRRPAGCQTRGCPALLRATPCLTCRFLPDRCPALLAAACNPFAPLC